MRCRDSSLGTAVVGMVPRGYRDIQIQNSRVREVQAFNTDRFGEFYDIAEWKDLMLAAQRTPVRLARRTYVCMHYRGVK
jgi:hypothetical protein